jgi:hypothetical protein
LLTTGVITQAAVGGSSHAYWATFCSWYSLHTLWTRHGAERRESNDSRLAVGEHSELVRELRSCCTQRELRSAYQTHIWSRDWTQKASPPLTLPPLPARK